MKKIILGLITVLAFSCTSDKSKDENKDENSDKYTEAVYMGSLKLVETIETNLKYNTTKKLTYIYSEKGLLKTIVPASSRSNFAFIYRPDSKLDSIKEAYPDKNIQGSIIVFRYERDLISGDEIGNYYDKYLYNSKNQMITKSYRRYSDLDFSYVNYYEYDSNGNVLKEIKKDYGSTSATNGATKSITAYEYDNKINPYYAVFTDAYRKILEIGKNNRTRFLETVNEYTYNDKGYPIEKIEKEKGVAVSKTTYTYEANKK